MVFSVEKPCFSPPSLLPSFSSPRVLSPVHQAPLSPSPLPLGADITLLASSASRLPFLSLASGCVKGFLPLHVDLSSSPKLFYFCEPVSPHLSPLCLAPTFPDQLPSSPSHAQPRAWQGAGEGLCDRAMAAPQSSTPAVTQSVPFLGRQDLSSTPAALEGFGWWDSLPGAVPSSYLSDPINTSSDLHNIPSRWICLAPDGNSGSGHTGRKGRSWG